MEVLTSVMAKAQQKNLRHAHPVGVLPSSLGGRPKKYDDEWPEMAYALLTNPHVVYSMRGIAAALGISSSTLYDYMKRYKVFEQAITRGRAIQEVYLASSLINQSSSNDGIKFLLKNLHKWREAKGQEVEKLDISSIILNNSNSFNEILWRED